MGNKATRDPAAAQFRQPRLITPADYDDRGYLAPHPEPWEEGWEDHAVVRDSQPERVFGRVALNVARVACGAHHSMVLTATGNLFACGMNHHGQLGVGDLEHRVELTAVVFQHDEDKCVVDVTLGSAHSIARTPLHLIGCGDNSNLQLGTSYGDRPLYRIFARFTLPVEHLSDIDAICAGHDNTIYSTVDGKLFEQGGHTQLEFSDGELRHQHVAQISSRFRHTYALTSLRSLYGMGRCYLGLGAAYYRSEKEATRVQCSETCRPIAAECGVAHSCVILGDGSLLSVGKNDNGELGTGDRADRDQLTPVEDFGAPGSWIIQVACGDAFTVVLRSDGSAWSCGSNMDGQLGIGVLCQRSRWSLVAKNVVSMAVGHKHALFLHVDGSVRSSGLNNWGQLGVGDEVNRFSPDMAVAPRFWSVDIHRYFPKATRDVITTMLLLTYCQSAVRLIPIEVMFLIFECLPAV